MYRSYPPQPDIPRPDHLLPSAAAEAKRARVAAAQRSSESTVDESPQAEKETEGEARRDNSSGPAVELTEALPLVPQGRRVVRKRKAQEIESSRYWLLPCCIAECRCCYVLTVSTCSPSASSSRIWPEEVGAAPSAATAVTIAVAGTTPPAGETPPPATETPRQALLVKRAIKKKSTL
jgi:hypothetical protein